MTQTKTFRSTQGFTEYTYSLSLDISRRYYAGFYYPNEQLPQGGNKDVIHYQGHRLQFKMRLLDNVWEIFWSIYSYCMSLNSLQIHLTRHIRSLTSPGSNPVG